LDSFPINRLDMPLPFDTRIQAKPAYFGMIDPTQLAGFGLSFAITDQTGPQSARVWTITATNPSNAPAYTTQINNFSLFQIRGRPCEPTVSTTQFPVVLGDIPATGTATASFTINFDHCSKEAEFEVFVPWSSATYHTGVLTAHRHP
jgi:endo-1,4-beta-xylanase